METLTKKEAEGLFKGLGEKLDKLFAKFVPKNVVPITFEDGTTATSDADSIDGIVGSNIIGQDGNPLPDNDYETNDGFKLTVQGGVVTAYAPLAGDAPDAANETQALKDQIAALTKQLADATNEKKAAVTAKVEADKKFKAVTEGMTELKNELEQIKNKTFGSTRKPDVNPKFMAQEEEKEAFDPMAELADAYQTSHPNSPLFKR